MLRQATSRSKCCKALQKSNVINTLVVFIIIQCTPNQPETFVKEIYYIIQTIDGDLHYNARAKVIPEQ